MKPRHKPHPIDPRHDIGLTRRHALKLGVAVSLSFAVAPRLAFAGDGAARTIAFYNLHTGENLQTTFWADGGYVSSALREIDWVLRDFRTGDVKAIDPPLLDILHALQVKLDTQEPFQVISGYRSPATNAMLLERSSGVAARSFHLQGRAIDINVPSRALSQIRGAALSLQAGGVGYYPKSDFVHVDNGPIRHWG